MRWVTLTERAERYRRVTFEQYESLVSGARGENSSSTGLREQIEMMGGDLVQNKA